MPSDDNSVSLNSLFLIFFLHVKANFSKQHDQASDETSTYCIVFSHSQFCLGGCLGLKWICKKKKKKTVSALMHRLKLMIYLNLKYRSQLLYTDEASLSILISKLKAAHICYNSTVEFLPAVWLHNSSGC